VIYGSVAAAIMAYGLSLFYGLTGSAQLADLANVTFSSDHAIWSDWTLQTRAALTTLVALVMVFMGVAYKMSTLPMHFWAPDVYEGAPTPVTAFLSVLSKAAGFALALRFLSALPANDLAPAWEKIPWVEMMIILSIVTMTFGNLSALWQTNLKRMLAYSSIAHAGYMMMAFVILHASGVTGSQALGFYLLTYLAMNFGAFAVVILIENRLGSVDLEEYQGLLVDLAAAELEINLSIKPSQFGMGLDWNEGVERASRLGGEASDAGGFLRWEMEGSETVDPTLEGFNILRNRFGSRVGCVLQSMLHRTADDARTLLAESGPLNVRLVKGVYVEPPEIAFVQPEAITASYLETLEILLEGGAWV
ncbi:MAG: hypothetical protein MK138_15775, partial [Planctomycetes bacterium]|nr:hypothetical protein [Planctomycetota bacterium]